MQMDIIKTTCDKLRVTSDCHRDEKLKQGRERVSRYGYQDIYMLTYILKKTNISQENRKNREVKWKKAQ